MIHSPSIPYWRLSGFYFFYFASLGALVPYLSLYLKTHGYSALQIGVLVGTIPATKIFAPYIIGWLADIDGRGMRIVRWANFLAVLVFALVFLHSGFYWLALVLTGFSFFWNSALPQFEATTLNHLGDHVHHYSNIRLWGSLGFIVMVVLLGEWFETASIDNLLGILLGLLLAIWLASLLAPSAPCRHDHEHVAIVHVIRQPVVLAFLVICFLMLLSHGPYYTFYTIYLEDHGYSRRLIGLMWAVGVIAEVVMFLLLPRFFSRLGVRFLLLLTFALTSLRWLLIGFFPSHLVVLLFAQLLHAFSFGVFHAVGITLVHRFFRGIYQGRGQALYASLSFGAGGAVGSLLSGGLWDVLPASSLFALAAGVSALAGGIVWRYMKLD